MKSNRFIAKFVTVLDELDKQGHNVPGLILSHPGFGKTSTIRMYCQYKDYNLESIIPSQHASDDILGLQSIDQATGRLVRKTPSWFNNLVDTMKNGKRTLLFIDEISTCDPYIQGPLLDLIFSRSLGEHKLPENVFIIAAGNYSEDLNSEFKMSSPLVNRFVLLNLSADDFNISEILKNSFESLKTKSDIEKYLDLKTENDPQYEFSKFSDWVKNSKEIGFGKTTVEEVEGLGTLGFTSVRSLSYSLKFAQTYMSYYSDDLWVRIVGDTLGTAKKHEGMPLRKVIMGQISDFLKVGKNNGNSIPDILDAIEKEGKMTDEQYEQLKTIFGSYTLSNFSPNELKKFASIASKHYMDPRIVELNKLINAAAGN